MDFAAARWNHLIAKKRRPKRIFGKFGLHASEVQPLQHFPQERGIAAYFIEYRGGRGGREEGGEVPSILRCDILTPSLRQAGKRGLLLSAREGDMEV